MHKINFPSQITKAITMLQNRGFEAYAVGGCVRDGIIGTVPKDYDITTSAHPEQTADVFCTYTTVNTGLRHGTVTVIIDDIPIEITTYRIESKYSDNRRPDSVTFTNDLKSDLARRDFTINALAYDDTFGIVDPFGGIDDIKSEIVRCVGEPNERFCEDALRILRALRFSSVLGFKIEAATSDAAKKNKHLLKNISSERITSELKGILCGKNAQNVLIDYPEIFAEILPELFPDNKSDVRHDNYLRAAANVAKLPNDFALRFAALFKDVGKLHYINSTANKNIDFHDHAKISANITAAVLNRLKFDNASKKLIITLIKHHDMQIPAEKISIKRALNKLSPEIFYKLIALKCADSTTHAEIAYCDAVERTTDKIIADHECFLLKDLDICGRDLINAESLDGKSIGAALEFLLESVIDEKVENQKQALLKYLHGNINKLD